MKYLKTENQTIIFRLIFLFLSGCNTPATATLMSPTLKPTQTSVAPTATIIPTSTIVPIRPGDVLFFEDFEDGKADGLNYEGSNWKVISDGAGNMIYEVNTIEDNSGPSIGFGSTSWTNYSVEYRVKILNSNGDIWMNFRNSSMGYYVQRLSWEYDSVNLYFSPAGHSWEPIIESSYYSLKNKWYLIRVEAQGEVIRIFINDNLTITKTDSRLMAGDIAIGNLGNTHAQYDDIQVIALEE